MPEKSLQPVRSHLAGVSAPLCGLSGSLQGCASQKIALSSLPPLPGGKRAKTAVEESLDP